MPETGLQKAAQKDRTRFSLASVACSRRKTKNRRTRRKSPENPKKRRTNAPKSPEHARDGAAKRYPKKPDSRAVLRPRRIKTTNRRIRRKSPENPKNARKTQEKGPSRAETGPQKGTRKSQMLEQFCVQARKPRKAPKMSKSPESLNVVLRCVPNLF